VSEPARDDSPISMLKDSKEAPGT